MILPLHLKASLNYGEWVQATPDRERGQYAEREEFRLVHHVPLDGANEGRRRLYRRHVVSERGYRDPRRYIRTQRLAGDLI